MKLSIRTKILGGYSFVIILFFAIILNIIFTQRIIRDKLKVINSDFLPKLNMVNSLTNYSHLEDSFDVKKLKAAVSNRFLLQNIGTYHPKLLEKKLDEIILNMNNPQGEHLNPGEKRLFSLLAKSVIDVKRMHGDYHDLIVRLIELIKKGKSKEAFALEGALERKKRELK